MTNLHACAYLHLGLLASPTPPCGVGVLKKPHPGSDIEKLGVVKWCSSTSFQPPSGGLSAFSAQNSVQADRMRHRRTHRPHIMPTRRSHARMPQQIRHTLQMDTRIHQQTPRRTTQVIQGQSG